MTLFYITLADQIQNDFLLLEPKNPTLDCICYMFQHCHPHDLIGSSHIYHNLLEICEKVSGPPTVQDQKDYKEALIMILCSSTAQMHFVTTNNIELLNFYRFHLPFRGHITIAVCKRGKNQSTITLTLSIFNPKKGKYSPLYSYYKIICKTVGSQFWVPFSTLLILYYCEITMNNCFKSDFALHSQLITNNLLQALPFIHSHIICLTN